MYQIALCRWKQLIDPYQTENEDGLKEDNKEEDIMLTPLNKS